MRVLIVDHHPLVRDGLKTAFGTADEIDVVGEAATGEEAIKLAQDLLPDFVFMDLRLLGMDGIQATRIIRERRPHTKVILFTTDDSPASVSEAIRAGASGYLLKDAGVNELVHAAKEAMAGKAVIHPSLTQVFIEEVRLVDRKPEVPLSPLEIEILQQVAFGATSKEVADHFGISFRTVKTHLDVIFEKLGANDRAQAVSAQVRSRGRAARRRRQGGDDVRVCQKHNCCYQVILREAAGSPLNRVGEWHFTWHPAASLWRLHYPARQITTERPVTEGVSPTLALLGSIPGKTISQIARQIERLGFPPPGCIRDGGQNVVKEATVIHLHRPRS